MNQNLYHQYYFEGYCPQAMRLAKTTSDYPPTFVGTTHVAETGWYVPAPTQKWIAPRTQKTSKFFNPFKMLKRALTLTHR